MRKRLGPIFPANKAAAAAAANSLCGSTAVTSNERLPIYLAGSYWPMPHCANPPFASKLLPVYRCGSGLVGGAGVVGSQAESFV